MAKYLASILFVLLLFPLAISKARVDVIPNFTNLQRRFDSGEIPSFRINQIRDLLRACLIRSARIDDNACRLLPAQLRIYLRNGTRNGTRISPRGLKFIVRPNNGKAYSLVTDSEGTVTFNQIRINDYPLTIEIPLLGYRTPVQDPAGALTNLVDITARLNRCANNGNRSIYTALFKQLLNISQSRGDSLATRASFVISYYRDFLLNGCCSNIRDYLSGLEMPVYFELRKGVSQSCPGIKECLPQ